MDAKERVRTRKCHSELRELKTLERSSPELVDFAHLQVFAKNPVPLDNIEGDRPPNIQRWTQHKQSPLLSPCLQTRQRTDPTEEVVSVLNSSDSNADNSSDASELSTDEPEGTLLSDLADALDDIVSPGSFAISNPCPTDLISARLTI